MLAQPSKSKQQWRELAPGERANLADSPEGTGQRDQMEAEQLRRHPALRTCSQAIKSLLERETAWVGLHFFYKLHSNALRGSDCTPSGPPAPWLWGSRPQAPPGYEGEGSRLHNSKAFLTGALASGQPARGARPGRRPGPAGCRIPAGRTPLRGAPPAPSPNGGGAAPGRGRRRV